MGAQTRESLEAVASLATAAKGASAPALAGLFQAARALTEYPSLLAALADSSHDASQRSALLDGALSNLDKDSRALLDQVVELSWSSPADLLEGIEQFGVRLAASFGTPDEVVAQLLGLSRIIRGHAELQLALSDKRATVVSKHRIVQALGAKKMNGVALEVASHIAALPRGRRASEALVDAAELVCEHDGRGLAEVQVASAPSAAQLTTIQGLLKKKFGTECYLDVVINPEVIGGARIRVGDVVMDGSVHTQLGEMRRQLAS